MILEFKGIFVGCATSLPCVSPPHVGEIQLSPVLLVFCMPGMGPGKTKKVVGEGLVESPWHNSLVKV